jgi:putative FmdB family regulatory protein
MPIYAYRCTTCGHAQDVLRKISDPPLSVCSACGAATFVKQVTAAGFQLKGSGWYVTDFRGDKKSAKPADADGAAAAEGKPTDGSGGDGKGADGKGGEGKPANAKPADAGAGKDTPKGDAKKAVPAAAPAAAPAPAAPAPAPPAPAKGGT